MRALPRLPLLLALLAPVAALAQIPVTPKVPIDGPGVFRFAILPDRTGGMRAGVFEKAVAKVQLMQPEFVMSVGDLIDGYTEDPAIWNAEWEEFARIIAPLQMPFYHVAGNHDVSNPAMVAEWRRRLGDAYYSFEYKGVLFLVLHTEDKSEGGLGAEQIAFARDVLKRHASAPWTLVFFHRPLWLYEDKGGYEQIEEVLAGRRYAVFTGHHHHYLKAVRHGMPHYTLATCGGGTALRGAEFGEFDAFTWVTMTPDGPRVANLSLEGVIEDDIVNEGVYPITQLLRLGTWFSAPPVVAAEPTFERLGFSLKFTNPTAAPLSVTGTIAETPLYRVEPATVKKDVAASSELTVPFTLIAKNGRMTPHQLNEARVRLELTGSAVIDGRTLSLPETKQLRFDAEQPLSDSLERPRIDGNLADWNEAEFTRVTQPMHLQEGWDWSGPDDGRFDFAVRRCGEDVFVAVRTIDDRLLTSSSEKDRQDRVTVSVENSRGLRELDAVCGVSTATTACAATTNGMTAEFAFPGAARDASFRLQVRWVDHDRPENTKPSVLWWRDPAVKEFGVYRIR
ncbi:metallophosphoesterase [Nibricoccus sp. IMCC34717]|uniref:metallophosphoesterase n=1 Tax=Nibricoccus sp. IMCC34717 TaxID=3034021 RepID=UPI00384DB8A7